MKEMVVFIELYIETYWIYTNVETRHLYLFNDVSSVCFFQAPFRAVSPPGSWLASQMPSGSALGHT